MRLVQSVVAAVIVVALAAPALAQSRGQGHMMGVVKDESGQPVEGVQVKAVRQGDKDAFTDKTNKKGEWAINGLASGQWNLDFSKQGYENRGYYYQAGIGDLSMGLAGRVEESQGKNSSVILNHKRQEDCEHE